MPSGPVRRAQLIAPFGVGAMSVMKGGVSLMTAGLDHWYEREPGPHQDVRVDPDEFIIQEWRLERALHVGHFRTPPDFRKRRGFGVAIPNSFLTVPFVRFPQWHFCPRCRRLEKVAATHRARVICPECREEGWRNQEMAQVQWVAICGRGHIQDFPWREWVHRTSTPACQETTRLFATGGTGLAAQQVRCDCGVPPRNLLGVVDAEEHMARTTLSDRLENGAPYLCSGHMPWLGQGASEACGLPVKGSLRNAGNVYYSEVRSALFLPRESDTVSNTLLNLLDEPTYSAVIRIMEEETTPVYLRRSAPGPLTLYSDAEITGALAIILAGRREAAEPPETLAGENAAEIELRFRQAEHAALRAPRTSEDLVVRASPLTEYAADIRNVLARVTLIEKLRETRAFVGFSRIFAEDGRTLTQKKAALWRAMPRRTQSWLPAHVVYGEGLYIELDEARVRLWEQNPDILDRVAGLGARYRRLQHDRRLRERAVTPRLVLVHTLSHLLMSRLTFDCGYSSASLRERLYVSDSRDTPMAGVLIYTAAGDAEGTMGGLVRMGKAGQLEPVFRRALANAEWCSADPVCAETSMQGPDSTNLAACHSCALVPETACEEFNRFLDRALVVPTIRDPHLAFFQAEALAQ